MNDLSKVIVSEEHLFCLLLLFFSRKEKQPCTRGTRFLIARKIFPFEAEHADFFRQIQDFPDKLNFYVTGNVSFFKSSWPEIRGNAAMFAGKLYFAKKNNRADPSGSLDLLPWQRAGSRKYFISGRVQKRNAVVEGKISEAGKEGCGPKSTCGSPLTSKHVHWLGLQRTRAQ